MRILIAGIGNIFHGDDGFGVEVAKALLQCDWPDDVQVADFGIRSYDLAYAIIDGYDVTILVDAMQRGKPPGTLTLLEPDLSVLEVQGEPVVNGHSMDPVLVLQLVHSLGGEAGQLYVLGCEPAVLQTENGYLGLSEPVQAAVPEAVGMIEALVHKLLQKDGNVEVIHPPDQ